MISSKNFTNDINVWWKDPTHLKMGYPLFVHPLYWCQPYAALFKGDDVDNLFWTDFIIYKKVILRERKRRIKYSIRCPIPGGGTPSLDRRGTPSLDGRGTRGYPIPGCGTPHLDLVGVLPERDLGPVTEVSPGKDMGPVEVLWDGDGVPPPPGVDRQTLVKTVPSRRTTYALGKNVLSACFEIELPEQYAQPCYRYVHRVCLLLSPKKDGQMERGHMH